MATKMTIRTRSGDVFDIPLDAEAAPMTPDEAAEKFHNAMDFINIKSIRIGNRAIYTREIESFTFT